MAAAGEHENKKQDCRQKHGSDINIASITKRQLLDHRAATQNEKDIDNLKTQGIEAVLNLLTATLDYLRLALVRPII